MLNPDELLPAEITVQVEGVKDQLRLHHLQGHEGLGVLFEYQLDLVNWDESDIVRDQLAPEGCLSPEALLGKSLTVTLPLAGQKVRHINGLITQAAFRESIDHHTAYAVTLRPQLWLLTLTQSCRVFQGKDVPTVVNEILEEHRLSPARKAWTGSHRTWDTLTQYRESDFAFISRLLAREGFYYFFEHSEQGHTLVLADDSLSTHEEHPDFKTIAMGKPKPIAGSNEHLRTWQAHFHLQSEAVSLADHDFRLRRPSAEILGQAASAKSTQGLSSDGSDSKGDAPPPREIYDFPAGAVLSENKLEANPGDNRSEADELARIRREAKRCLAARYEGEGAVRWLSPGLLFRVEGCDPQKPFLATDTDITLRNPAFLSGQTSIEEPCEIIVKAMDSQTPFRLFPTDKPRVLGPQTAWVVGGEHDEISTDKYGRIQVHFHWDRDRPSEKGSSCWVRVAQPWAGNGFGMYSIPRVGSEVVVEFLYGDPDRPLVTGSVYSGENLPPYEDLSKHKTRSGIKTRSSKGATPHNYNEIYFEDYKDHEELHLQAERNLTAVVKHDQIVQVQGERNITVKNGDKLDVLDSDKTVTVQGAYDITANRLFHLLVGQGPACSASSPTCSLDLRDGVVTVEAQNEITLQCGQASLSLKQDGTITMKGTKLSFEGSELIEANGKDATLKLSKTIEAQGTKVTLKCPGDDGAKLDLDGDKASLSSKKLTTIKGDAVEVN